MLDQTERRAEIRHRTLKGGRIVFNDGRSTIDCTIRNLSPTGARLRVTTILGVPDTFDLSVAHDRFACRVVWRKLEELGVEFAR